MGREARKGQSDEEKDMIVTGIQMDIAWESPRENFRRVEDLAAGAEGSSLLVLPEMFSTGFSMEAERVAGHSEVTREFMAGLAAQLSLHVLGGYAEPGDPRPANACSIFNPEGTEILHFRKLHPFSLAGEENHYVGGEELRTVEVDGVRITPLICYDLRFPEPFRVAARNTDLFCVIANWPEKRREAWSALLRARAIENQAFVLGVNRVGMGGGESHTGDSVLLDPLGRAVADGSLGESGNDTWTEGLVRGEVSPKVVRRIRSRFSFLADRRPELYRRLEEDFS